MKNEMKLGPFIVAVALAAALPLVAGAQDYENARIDTTVRLDRGGTVDLSLISGRIRVTGWDRSDVKIVASIDQGLLTLDANGSRVTLSVDDAGGNRRHRGRHDVGDARYEVSVPRGSRLILEAVSGDVSAAGSQGEIEATSVSGTVDVANGSRAVSVESVSGSVRAVEIDGNLRAESVSGNVRVENAAGNVQANSVSGNLRLIGIRSKDVRSETVSGDVVYSGTIEPGGRYSFESHSGNVHLNIPSGAGAQFSVETFSGDIRTDFPVTIASGRSRKEGRMDFTIGDGRARVTAQTFSGRIVVNSGSESTIRRNDD
jgi:DUF4097 and DUF4098 domain-containing protein YvlB